MEEGPTYYNPTSTATQWHQNIYYAGIASLAISATAALAKHTFKIPSTTQQMIRAYNFTIFLSGLAGIGFIAQSFFVDSINQFVRSKWALQQIQKERWDFKEISKKYSALLNVSTFQKGYIDLLQKELKPPSMDYPTFIARHGKELIAYLQQTGNEAILPSNIATSMAEAKDDFEELTNQFPINDPAATTFKPRAVTQDQLTGRSGNDQDQVKNGSEGEDSRDKTEMLKLCLERPIRFCHDSNWDKIVKLFQEKKLSPSDIVTEQITLAGMFCQWMSSNSDLKICAIQVLSYLYIKKCLAEFEAIITEILKLPYKVYGNTTLEKQYIKQESISKAVNSFQGTYLGKDGFQVFHGREAVSKLNVQNKAKFKAEIEAISDINSVCNEDYEVFGISKEAQLCKNRWKDKGYFQICKEEGSDTLFQEMIDKEYIPADWFSKATNKELGAFLVDGNEQNLSLKTLINNQSSLFRKKIICWDDSIAPKGMTIKNLIFQKVKKLQDFETVYGESIWSCGMLRTYGTMDINIHQLKIWVIQEVDKIIGKDATRKTVEHCLKSGLVEPQISNFLKKYDEEAAKLSGTALANYRAQCCRTLAVFLYKYKSEWKLTESNGVLSFQPDEPWDDKW